MLADMLLIASADLSGCKFRVRLYSPTHVQRMNSGADFDNHHRGGAVAFLPITAVLPQHLINAIPLLRSLPQITAVAITVSSSTAVISATGTLRLRLWW